MVYKTLYVFFKGLHNWRIYVMSDFDNVHMSVRFRSQVKQKNKLIAIQTGRGHTTILLT